MSRFFLVITFQRSEFISQKTRIKFIKLTLIYACFDNIFSIDVRLIQVRTLLLQIFPGDSTLYYWCSFTRLSVIDYQLSNSYQGNFLSWIRTRKTSERNCEQTALETAINKRFWLWWLNCSINTETFQSFVYGLKDRANTQRNGQ